MICDKLTFSVSYCLLFISDTFGSKNNDMINGYINKGNCICFFLTPM